MISVEGNRLVLEGAVTRDRVPSLYRAYRGMGSLRIDAIDLSEVERIDNSGVALVDYIRSQRSGPVRLEGARGSVAHTIDLFGRSPEQNVGPQTGTPLLLRLGSYLFGAVQSTGDYVRLASDIVFWTILSPFDRRSRRRGSVAEQCDEIGAKAVPIVGFLALVLGVILVLQSAAQLRRFGATIFVVDLLGISLTRETAPLFTAIIVAGRSGAAIAARLATMRVTEEIDALSVMALDPVRYVIVPMMAGMLLTIPVLTALAMLVGLAGGVGISLLTLDLSLDAFLGRLVEIVGFTDIFVGIVKSFFFGGVIVLTGSYFGLTASGSSAGVGRATTLSVVSGIFIVIVLNVLFSLLYLA